MEKPEITVHELHKRRDEGKEPFLLDVRKPREAKIAEIGGTLIPLDELPDRLDELKEHRDQEIIVHCRSGGRSERAVQFLRSQGFNAYNLKGGILAWSNEIDDSVPQY